jgi:hypothetical protein
VLAGVGFALAHLLHFGEVWAFYGSLGDALADLESSARYRAGFDQPKGWSIPSTPAWGWFTSSFFLPTRSLSRSGINTCTLPSFHFLGLTLGAWWPLVAVLLCATHESMSISSTAI